MLETVSFTAESAEGKERKLIGMIDGLERNENLKRSQEPGQPAENGSSDRGGRGRSRARGRSRRKGSAAEQAAVTENQEAALNQPEASGGGDGRFHWGRKQTAIAVGAAAAVLVIGGISYAGMSSRYKRVFFPGTEVNGLDVAGKTAAEAQEMIAQGINGYVLTIEERGEKTEQLSQEDIGLQAKFDGSLEKIIASQNPFAWGLRLFSPDSYKIQTMMEYDEEAFETALKAMECFDEETAKEPENAHLSEYSKENGYIIVPETEGTLADYEIVEKGVSEAILKLETRISLEELGAYAEPEITADDEMLNTLCENMNKAAGVTITYKFGEQTETLSGDRIHEWLTPNADGSAGVDSGKVSAYVKELADKYNTNHKSKTLKTSYGKTVTIKGGSYGWKINQAAEADELAALIRSGESQSGREPVYSQKAASHGANDYGDTYVEINLTAQHLFFYKNGSLLVESDFVSGNLSKGWGTPAGSFPLTYKQRDAVLKGENYRTPVDYWMPFNGGIGMHDAKWRSSFGGTIYKTGGSHGCINLPHSVAKKIYENISAGMPVLCYNLEGTEKPAAPEKPQETEPSTQAPAPSESASEAESKPSEPSQEAPSEPSKEQVQPTKPAETPAPAQPETTAPAGPASQGGNNSGPSGPGA